MLERGLVQEHSQQDGEGKARGGNASVWTRILLKEGQGKFKRWCQKEDQKLSEGARKLSAGANAVGEAMAGQRAHHKNTGGRGSTVRERLQTL